MPTFFRIFKMDASPLIDIREKEVRTPSNRAPLFRCISLISMFVLQIHQKGLCESRLRLVYRPADAVWSA